MFSIDNDNMNTITNSKDYSFIEGFWAPSSIDPKEPETARPSGPGSRTARRDIPELLGQPREPNMA